MAGLWRTAGPLCDVRCAALKPDSGLPGSRAGRHCGSAGQLPCSLVRESLVYKLRLTPVSEWM